jgi:hypothetical protein
LYIGELVGEEVEIQNASEKQTELRVEHLSALNLDVLLRFR